MQLRLWLLAVLVSFGVSAAHESTESIAKQSCKANVGNCAVRQALKSSMGPTLIQQHNSRLKIGSQFNSTAKKGVTTDCAQRLQHFSGRAAACLLLQNDRSLLVYVPYGRAPGWDFPGGNRKRSEAACETAERETFEETGIRVRAIEKLTSNVFKCEVVEDKPCRTRVDEGCLRKKWVTKNEIGSLRLRGGTWGDKRGLLHKHISSSPPSPPAGQPDACGCTSPQGWSSTRNRCSSTSVTSQDEAARCMAVASTTTASSSTSEQPDACGCFPPGGWSTTRSRCSSGSTTTIDEAAKCASKQPDACGCIFPQGWSTTRNRCRQGSQTDDWEGSQCASKLTV